jgi:hypothetical protein
VGVNSFQENVEVKEIIQIDHGYSKRMNNPRLDSCLHVVSESDRGRYQTCYLQNHPSPTPLVNDTLSKQMIT